MDETSYFPLRSFSKNFPKKTPRREIINVVTIIITTCNQIVDVVEIPAWKLTPTASASIAVAIDIINTSLKEYNFKTFSSIGFFRLMIPSMSIFPPIIRSAAKEIQVTTSAIIFPACSPPVTPTIWEIPSTNQYPSKGINACIRPNIKAIVNPFFLSILV